MSIQIKQLNYSYIQQNKLYKVLNDISLSVENKQFISIIGKSGSGKSTLLKILAGIITGYKGEVIINEINSKVKQQVAAYMPQKDLLIPFKTILCNLKIPLILQKMNNKLANNVINNYLVEFNLLAQLNKYPSELSGGECQRVALLRTILINSKILLLDEPFAALDAITKMQMQDFLYFIYKKYGYTVVLVTHDIEEAVFLSNKVYVLNQTGSLLNSVEIYAEEQNVVRNNAFRLQHKFLDYKAKILEHLS